MAITVPEDEVAAVRERVRSAGQRLVFTNGCFDLLHPGHLRFLARCRALGDLLWVGLNGDQSVRTLKGPGRPVMPEAERAYHLASLRAVDLVTIFPTTRVTGLLESIRPDIYAKAADYSWDTLDEAEKAVLIETGAKVEFLSYESGFSTTGLVASIRNS